MTTAQTKVLVLVGGGAALLYWLNRKTGPLASRQIGNGYLPALATPINSLHPAIQGTDPSAGLFVLPNVGPVNGDLIAAARAAMAGDDSNMATAAPSTVGLENEISRRGYPQESFGPPAAPGVLPSVQIGNGDMGPIDGSTGGDFFEDPSNDMVGDSITIVGLS